MTIEYRGREMPCFMQRQTHRGGCEQKATHIVEGKHVIMHVCETHAREMIQSPGFEMRELAPAGTLDRLPAESADPIGLLEQSPWVDSANGLRRE